MSIHPENYETISAALGSTVQLVAVSKTKPVEDIEALYRLGQRDFGENYVQELVQKQELLNKNIHWHFIGHLQSNKVKSIAPFVHLIHGVDSLNLLKEISKQASKLNRTIDCLLQIHIASEATKFGWDAAEMGILKPENLSGLNGVRIRGLMGMASFSTNETLVRNEFEGLKTLFDQLKNGLFKDQESFNILSMGMSGDYKIAVEAGSNMVRIGSLLFGERNYPAL